MSRSGRSGHAVSRYLRLVVVLAITAGIALADPNRMLDAPLVIFLSVAVAYSTLVAATGRRASTTTTAVDVLLLALLTYATGGADSDVGLAFTLIPLLVALEGDNKQTLVAVALSLGVFALTVGLHAELVSGDRGTALLQTLNASCRGVFVVAVSGLLAQRARAHNDLAHASRSLVSSVMRSDDRGRREQARALHDLPLQNLHVALHTLRREDPESQLLAESLLEGAIDQLRGQIIELYPPSLDHLGIGPAIEQLADRARLVTGVTISTDVSDLPRTAWDQLLYSSARELLANVTKHSCAQFVRVSLHADSGEAVLTVIDDGVGFADTTGSDGHLGLRDLRSRVQAIGGVFAVESRPAFDGSCVTIRLAFLGDGQQAPRASARLHA